MGIFDVIELKNHLDAINQYLLYIDAHPDDIAQCLNIVSGHCISMKKILDKFDK